MSKKQDIIAKLLKFKDFLTITIEIHNNKKRIKFNLLKGNFHFFWKLRKNKKEDVIHCRKSKQPFCIGYQLKTESCIKPMKI